MSVQIESREEYCAGDGAPPSHQVSADELKSGPNRFLATLSDEDRRSIAPQLAPVSYAAGKRLDTGAQPLRHVLFLTRGVAFLVGAKGDAAGAGLAVLGADAAVGMWSALGQRADAFEIGTGFGIEALQFPFEGFRKCFSISDTFRANVMRHAQDLTLDIARLALANRRHSLEQRLAGWLLLIRDRLGDDHIRLTHAALAEQLSVRRASVTLAMNALQERGLLQLHRAQAHLLDPAGLKACAGAAPDEGAV